MKEAHRAGHIAGLRASNPIMTRPLRVWQMCPGLCIRRQQTNPPAEQELAEARALARRNATCVHTVSAQEKFAGIFEAPSKSATASAFSAGLVLNCAASTLYMVRSKTLLRIWSTIGFCRAGAQLRGVHAVHGAPCALYIGFRFTVGFWQSMHHLLVGLHSGGYQPGTRSWHAGQIHAGLFPGFSSTIGFCIACLLVVVALGGYQPDNTLIACRPTTCLPCLRWAPSARGWACPAR